MMSTTPGEKEVSAAVVTKTLEAIEELAQQQDQDGTIIEKLWANYAGLSPQSKSQELVQRRLHKLRELTDLCESRNYKIEKLAGKVGLSTHDYFSDVKFTRIVDASLEAEACFCKELDSFKAAAAAANRASSSVQTATGNSTYPYEVPRIDVPPFSGDRAEWNSFRSLFESLVHHRADLAPVQKLHFLLASLRGDAALAYRDLEVVAEEYEPAWESLRARYESKRRTVFHVIRAFRAIPKVGRARVKELDHLWSRACATVKSLRRLGRPVGEDNDFFLTELIDKFDPKTRNNWEARFKDGDTFPTFEHLENFLREEIRVAEDSVDEIQKDARPSVPTVRPVTRVVKTHQTNVAHGCIACGAEHPLFQCTAFLQKSSKQRVELLKKYDRCLNCFRTGHHAAQCSGKNFCRTCKGRHHTLVHQAAMSSPPNVPTVKPADETESQVTSHLTSHGKPEACVLPTATVRIRGPSGACIIVRAILDQASQASFVSEAAAQFLGAPRERETAEVSVTGGNVTQREGVTTTVDIETLNNCIEPVRIRAFITKRVSRYALGIPKPPPPLPPLELADRSPDPCTPVQCLIGGEYLGAFMYPEYKRLPDSYAFYQRTAFGWVFNGSPAVGPEKRIIISHMTQVQPVVDELTRFWALEDVPTYRDETSEDVLCEKHFLSTHTRNDQGRYVVRLPTKGAMTPAPKGGKEAALAFFVQQEHRLSRNPSMKQRYDDFLEEYAAQGHMERAHAATRPQHEHWYLPHHAVVKREATEEKIRVVFNASYRCTGGTSLNDSLMIGPKLQADLFALLMRWRQFRYVMTSDITKMFRQILVAPEDRDLQRIWWRPTPEQPVVPYRLNTVTYGTACAPYLANRVLLQLAQDEGRSFPLAAPVLESSVYVDDILFGANSLAELQECGRQLKSLLRAGGFETHKWTANHVHLLREMAQAERDGSAVKSLGEDNPVRVLGIAWIANQDVFTFRVTPRANVISKRTFASLVAQLYDPLGWVSPVVVVGKILLQRLHQQGLAWDDPLPTDLAKRCHAFQTSLPDLHAVSLPRWTGHNTSASTIIQLHGFADASNQAYAAAVYMRVCCGGQCSVRLVYAKTKVAPLSSVSIPRLELSAAVLLTKAVNYVQKNLSLTDAPLFLWSDSTVTLAWLSAPPLRWKPYVANRVSYIQGTLSDAVWRHVPGTENPADSASRGISPNQLLTLSLWWQGPRWLREKESDWPDTLADSQCHTDEEKRRTIHSGATIIEPVINFERFSSWPRLLRTTAYVSRFIKFLRKAGATRRGDPLTVAEIIEAKTLIFRQLQAQFFDSKKVIQSGSQLSVEDKALQSLSLFAGDDGLLRVGGRVRHSSLPDYSKFPVLLPPCHVSKLLARHFHLCTLHGGLQVTLRLLRQRYWVLKARSIVKQCVRQCTTCVRHRANVATQFMGNLPPERVVPSRPFMNAGIDYAGPFTVRTVAGRGYKARKAYTLIFVCLSTRATHLECVSDYSTQAFLAAFRRFCARRGLPAHVYTDNGTNFVGADRELRRAFLAACKDSELQSSHAVEEVQWHFIPPAAPHFGGLWEAAVKAMKHHLKRTLGTSTPTYEEFGTLLCEIEAILNSRPLCPLHDDVETFDALTPGHFLVGTALKEAPEPSFLETADNRLSRWLVVEKRKQRFWRLWSADYLHAVQQRNKWQTPRENLKEGDLVIIKNSNAPPAYWELGRVSRTFPGSDQLVRVAEVKTARHILRRPITKLCKLPITDTVIDSGVPMAPR